jgi:hypothetical protein
MTISMSAGVVGAIAAMVAAIGVSNGARAQTMALAGIATELAPAPSVAVS